MDELMKIVKDRGFTRNDLIQEAECVEECGEWIHMSLLGFSADELRKAAERI